MTLEKSLIEEIDYDSNPNFTGRKGNRYKGKLYGADGEILYEGALIDSKPNGYGKTYNKNGTLKFEGIFKNGGIYGDNLIVYDPWGNYYIGRMKHGRKNGFGK